MDKPLEDAVDEVEFSAAIFEYYTDNAERFLADEINARPCKSLGWAKPADLMAAEKELATA